MRASSGTAVSGVLLAAGYLLIAPSANAQAVQPSAPPSAAPNVTQPPARSEDISDAKLDAAAKAVRGISMLQSTYEQKLQQTPQSDKARIADEADNAMAKVVADQGLSIEEYTNIIKLAQNDPTVHQKLLERLKQ